MAFASKMNEVDELLTFKQLIEMTGVRKTHARNLIKVKEIGRVDMDGNYIFDMSDVERVRGIIKTANSRKSLTTERPKRKSPTKSAKPKREKTHAEEENQLVENKVEAPLPEPNQKESQELSLDYLNGLITSVDERLSCEIRELFNLMMTEINALSDKVISLEPKKEKEIVIESGPDQKVYGGSFDFDLMKEAYSDYLDYLNKGIIQDINKSKIHDYSANVLVILSEYYSDNGKGMPVKTLLNKLNIKTNRGKFWFMASLGLLSEAKTIAVTKPNKTRYVTELNASLWEMNDYKKHRESVIGNKSSISN